jgi:protein-L-isoaspartate(D-aspartate) O-methyltransferase
MDWHPDLELDGLLQQIHDEVRDTAYLTGRSRLNGRIVQALREVPRHEFVPEALCFHAYANQPLPIGHGQTISQPYIVALMSDLISPQPTDVVLEIGTGSGYQAAVLSRLVQQVYSVEIIGSLAEQARQRLHRLGYNNVEVRVGNGHYGWPEHAPFDAIIVTAAAHEIPPALIEQLKPGGRLIIPVGRHFTGQNLRLVSKNSAGLVETHDVLPVIFVPMTN